MNTEKMGLFICQRRKAQNLTQKQLAQQLQITDKAVSKWERGISCPDVALLLPLAEVLGTTAGELLSGGQTKESTDGEELEDLVEEALLYSDKTTTQKTNRIKHIVLFLLFLCFVIAAATCLICDYAINHSFSWSLVVIASLAMGWVLTLPFFKELKHLARRFLTVLTIAILPFLFVLSLLLKVPNVFVLGGCIAPVAMIWLWGCYLLFKKLHDRRFLAGGFCCLITIPMIFGINQLVAAFFPAAGTDLISHFANALSLLFVAILLMGFDFFLGQKNA